MRTSPTILLVGVLLAVIAIQFGAVYGESLEEAWSVAFAQNQRLAAAKLERAAAAAGYEAALAERKPSVSLRSAYTLRSNEPSFVVRDPLPGSGTLEFPYAQDNSASAGAEVRVPVYTSGRIANAIQGAAARQNVSEEDAAQAWLDLLWSVGEAYLVVLRLQRDVEVAQTEWESLQAHAANIKQLRANERVADADVLAADVAVTAAWQRRLQQARALEVARGQYNRLLGRNVTAPVEVEEVQLDPLPGDFEQLVQLAWDRRPDLRALSADAAAHDFTSASVRGSSRPQVTASVGAQYEHNRFVDPQSLATAAVVVDWNLYNGGRFSRLADAEAVRASSVRCLAEDLKSQIAIDLLSAWNEVAEAAEQQAVAKQMIAHTTENLRVTQMRFARGMALNAAVLEAQTQWAQSQRDDYHSHYQGILAQLRIRYLTGSLCDSRPRRLPAIDAGNK